MILKFPNISKEGLGAGPTAKGEAPTDLDGKIRDQEVEAVFLKEDLINFDKFRKVFVEMVKSGEVESLDVDFVKKLLFAFCVDRNLVAEYSKLGVPEKEYSTVRDEQIEKYAYVIVNDTKVFCESHKGVKYKHDRHATAIETMNFGRDLRVAINDEISNFNYAEFIKKYIRVVYHHTKDGVRKNIQTSDSDLIEKDSKVTLIENERAELMENFLKNRNNPLELKNIIQKLVIQILEGRIGRVDDKQLIGQEINTMLGMLQDRTLSVNDVIDRTIGAYEERYFYSEK